MQDPYQTVLTSISAVMLLISAAGVYTCIYPRKKVSYFWMMIFLSLLPLISIFRLGAYESGDFNIHVYRTIAFYEAILDGQIMPSWPKDLNATYGYPLFIWMNALPYYLISIFHFFGFSFIMSTKIYLAFSFVLSGIGFWIFAKKQTSNELAVFTGTIFYLFAPYHLVDLSFRAAIGEVLAFAVLPFFMLSIQLLWEKRNMHSAILLGTTWGIFIFTHHAIAIFSLGLGISYVAFLYLKTKAFSLKIMALYIFSLVYGFLLSLYVWLPHVVMSKYTYGKILQNTNISFLEPWEFFFSPWKYGLLFQGPNGQLAFLLGYAHLIIIGFALYILFKHWKKLKISAISYYLLIIFLLIFMMLPASSFVWETIPLIRSAQFSTRLLVLMTFCSAMLAVLVSERIKKYKKLILFLVVVAILTTILNWGHRRVIPEIDDATLRTSLWASTAQGEGFYGLGMPKWTKLENMWINEKPEKNFEILEGDASIELMERRSNEHIYKVSADTQLKINENTLYFPGWEAFLNGKQIPISPSTTDNFGVINIYIPKGEHLLSLRYTDIYVLRLAKSISLVTLAITLLYFLYTDLLRKYLQKPR